MRNYFKTLRLPARAPQATLEQALAIGSPTAKEITPRHRVDANEILLDKERCDLYANTVELYEAMYVAYGRLQESVGMDTNSWAERLAEFEIAEADPDSLNTTGN
ncbi:MAG: hypothetical protein AB8B97_09370 [Granulosicoccus sp.]